MSNWLTVVGGGNGAHALAAIAASRGYQVRILASYANEAVAIKAGIAENGYLQAKIGSDSIRGQPVWVSDNPAETIPGSKLIVLVMPAFAFKPILEIIKPFLDKDAAVGAMPSRSGFEFLAKSILPQETVLFGLQTLPWACRIKEYGKSVDILGAKARISLASCPSSAKYDISRQLEFITGIEVCPAENMLSISLGNVGQIIHPGIMYGLFRNWNGQPFPEQAIPYFYQGVTAEIGSILEELSTDVRAVVMSLEKCIGIKLASVVSLKEWLLACYPSAIEDSSCLYRCFNTNKSYRGLKAPVKTQGINQYVPDFTTRYLTEDIPHGLVVTKALAHMIGRPTPAIDEVIEQTGKWMNKQYIVNGSLIGKNLEEAPIPQNYGITDVDSLIRNIF